MSHPTPTTARIGDRLDGRYELLRVLAHAPTGGAAYDARDLVLRRRVAVKVFPIAGAEQRSRFDAGIRLLAHDPTCFDVGREGELGYVVSDLAKEPDSVTATVPQPPAPTEAPLWSSGPGSLDDTASMSVSRPHGLDRTDVFAIPLPATPPEPATAPLVPAPRRDAASSWSWALWVGLVAALGLVVVAWVGTEGRATVGTDGTSTTDVQAATESSATPLVDETPTTVTPPTTPSTAVVPEVELGDPFPPGFPFDDGGPAKDDGPKG